MSFDILPNEPILYVGEFFLKTTLNTFIQTQKRSAMLLTPWLYDEEIRSIAKHP
jgi:hypothetical protein